MIWKQKVAKGEPRLTAAANYVADDGEAKPTLLDQRRMFTAAIQGATPLLKLVMATRSGALHLAYRYGQCGARFGNRLCYQLPGYQLLLECRFSHNFAVNGFWKPAETGFIPSVSAGLRLV